LQGVIIPSAILKIVFRHILFIFGFLNAVWALASGGFRMSPIHLLNHGTLFQHLLIFSYTGTRLL